MNEKQNSSASIDLLDKAKNDLAANMEERGIGAILWDNATAGFPYLPELEVEGKDGEPETHRVMGIYSYKGELYLIEEDESHIDFNSFYNPDSEVKPTIVTLTPDVAEREFGDPAERKGFTDGGDLEEWLAIADCYFQALAEEE